MLAGVIVPSSSVAGGAVFATVGAASGADYRTATVTTRSVAQTLDAVATIEPANQAAVAFPVSGTVASTTVAVGDTVAIGQVLATLDTTALQATVDERQAALDQAELTLERARNGESVGGSGKWERKRRAHPGGGVHADPTSTGQPRRPAPTRRSAPPSRRCSTRSSTSTPTSSPRSTHSTPPTSCARRRPPIRPIRRPPPRRARRRRRHTTSTDDASTTACRDALQAVLDAQHTVAKSQPALAQAATALDALLEARASTSSANGIRLDRIVVARASSTGSAPTGRQRRARHRRRRRKT